MKISSNFINVPMQQVASVLVPVFGFSVLMLLMATSWLIVEAAAQRRELPELRLQLERVKANATEPLSLSVPLPPAQELDETRDRVLHLNAMSQTRGMNTMALLSVLEARLPPQAWLMSLYHRATAGEVILVAAATKADTLSEFLLKLEKDPLFEEALLMRELAPSSTTKGAVQFEIRLKVHS